MAKKSCKAYDFQCGNCHHEFRTTMWSVDKNYDGNWDPEGVICPECDTHCIPPDWSRPVADNRVSDKDIRTGNWLHKSSSDWKDFHNKIVDRNKSSLSKMSKI